MGGGVFICDFWEFEHTEVSVCTMWPLSASRCDRGVASPLMDRDLFVRSHTVTLYQRSSVWPGAEIKHTGSPECLPSPTRSPPRLTPPPPTPHPRSYFQIKAYTGNETESQTRAGTYAYYRIWIRKDCNVFLMSGNHRAPHQLFSMARVQ